MIAIVKRRIKWGQGQSSTTMCHVPLVDQKSKAETFRALHRPGVPLRLLNAWDAGTARLFEAAGSAAIGTTSAGIAFALGRPDGQYMDRSEMISSIGRIATAVEIPVTADIESGFGEEPSAVAETVRLTIDAGAVGVNLEDADKHEDNKLVRLEQQVDLVRAARRMADAAGVPLFINARTDVYLLGIGKESDRLAATLERLNAYIEAGADGVFVPGLRDSDTIAELAAKVEAPLNVLIWPGAPKVDELAELGVARVSVGSGPSRAALGSLKLMADQLIHEGTYTQLSTNALSYDDTNALYQ